MLKGNCLCGGVEFEVDAEATMAGICHCTRCQRASGGGSLPAFLVEPDTFKIVSGADQMRAHAEEGFATRHFCGKCGSGIYATSENFTVVNAGVLAPGSAFSPQFHMMVDFKAPWDTIGDGLPQFGEYPPMPGAE
jgi:hypothetical protein